MKTILTLITAMLVLTGCATNPDYALYAKAQADMAISQNTAKAAKYKALADIAIAGGEGAKSSATMALALDDHGSATQSPQLQAPQASTALQWAQVLVPGLTQVMGMRYNYLSAQTQSNNATALGISTNGTFSDIAGKIQAPGSVTNNTLSGTGTLGSGAYSTQDRHDVVTPAPVITPVTPIVPVVVNPPVVIQPIIQSAP